MCSCRKSINLRTLFAFLCLSFLVFTGSGCEVSPENDYYSSKKAKLAIWNSENKISQKLVEKETLWHEGDKIIDNNDGEKILEIHATTTKSFVSLYFNLSMDESRISWDRLRIMAPDLLYNPDEEAPLIASLVMELYGFEPEKKTLKEIRVLTATYVFRADTQDWLLLSQSLYRNDVELNDVELIDNYAIWKMDFYKKHEKEDEQLTNELLDSIK